MKNEKSAKSMTICFHCGAILWHDVCPADMIASKPCPKCKKPIYKPCQARGAARKHGECGSSNMLRN